MEKNWVEILNSWQVLLLLVANAFGIMLILNKLYSDSKSSSHKK